MDDETGSNSIFAISWLYFINIFATIVLICLVGGFFYVVIYLSERDMTKVPIIRALDTHIRERPNNPGGKVTEHADLAINEAQEKIKWPDSESKNIPISNRGNQEEQVDKTEMNKENNETKPINVIDVTQPKKIKEIGGFFADEIDEIDESDASDETSLKQDMLSLQKPVTATPETTNLSSPAIDASPSTQATPRKKPQNLETSVKQTRTKKSVDIPVRDIQSGTWVAYIGTFGRQRLANAAWDFMNEKFNIPMKDKRRVIEKKASNGNSAYHLNIWHFKSREETQKFCDKIEKAQIKCSPTQF